MNTRCGRHCIKGIASIIGLTVALSAPGKSEGRNIFWLGAASNFVLLGDTDTYMVGNNSQITGNIGVGSNGRLTLSGGPFDLTGSIFLRGPDRGRDAYDKTSGTNNISGVVQQNDSLVTSALSAITKFVQCRLRRLFESGNH